MIIPEYVAQQQLDTDRRGMPQPTVISGIGEGLQNIGSSLSQLGDHIQAKQDQRDQTNANYAYEDWAQRSQVNAKNVIDHAPVDGSGVHNTVVDVIQEDANKVLSTLPQKFQEEFKHKTANRISDHSIAAADAEYNISSTYHAGKIDTIVNSKATTLANSPDLYKQEKADAYKLIDQSPLNSVDKEKLKRKADVDLANGKFEGDLKYNTQNVKGKLGINDTKISLSGATYSNSNGPEVAKAIGKQLQFAWHELNTTEATAGGMVAGAKNLEQAVSGGIAFERPGVPNFAGRLANARSVLAGTASKSAMAARSYFESVGMSPISASGFVGSLMGESGKNLDPRALNKNDGKDGSNSVGIGQWNGDRARALQAFTGDTSISISGHDGKVPPQFNRGQAASIDPAYAGMSVEWKIQKANQADVYIRQQEDIAQNQAKVALNEDVPHALGNFQLSGQTDKEPTYDQFIRADQQTADAKFAEYNSKKQTALRVYSMQGMSDDQLDAEVKRVTDIASTGHASVLDIKSSEAIQQEATGLKNANNVKSAASATEAKNALKFQWDNYMEDVKATQDAATQLKKLWKDEPFKAALSNKNVSHLWDQVASEPQNIDKRRMAVTSILEAQKTHGVAIEDMQLIPSEAADKIVSTWKNTDLPTPQKQAQVMAAINLAPDSTSKYVMFNQLRKAGLPSLLEGAIDASVENRDAGVVNRLFEAASINTKDINTTESDDKINQAAYDSLSIGKGATYYGISSGSAANVVKMRDGANLVARAAKMRMATDGIDMASAIELAKTDLLGSGELLDTSVGNGTKVNVITPEGVNTSVLTQGFSKAAEDLKLHMYGLAAQSLTTPTLYIGGKPAGPLEAENKVQQKILAAEIRGYVDNSTFVKVDGGYALQHNDTHMLIPESLTNLNPKIFTLDQLLEMGKTNNPIPTSVFYPGH